MRRTVPSMAANRRSHSARLKATGTRVRGRARMKSLKSPGFLRSTSRRKKTPALSACL